MQASVYEKHGKHQQPTVLVVFAFHLAKALTVVQDEVLLWLHIASSLACVSTLPHLGAGLSLLSCMAPIAFPYKVQDGKAWKSFRNSQAVDTMWGRAGVHLLVMCQSAYNSNDCESGIHWFRLQNWLGKGLQTTRSPQTKLIFEITCTTSTSSHLSYSLFFVAEFTM